MKIFVKKGLKFGLSCFVLYELLNFACSPSTYFDDAPSRFMYLAITLPIWVLVGLGYAYFYEKYQQKKKEAGN